MSATTQRVVGAVVVLVSLGVAAVLLWPAPTVAPDADPVVAQADAGTPSPASPRLTSLRQAAPAMTDGGLPAAAAAPSRALATFGWGSGDGHLGRDRPDEANPEAPMSFTTDAHGNTWVLDQVNQRLVKLDKNGKQVATMPLAVQAAQDIAVAKDGTIAVMDRLVDRTVSLMNPDGTPKGELKLEGNNLPEGGGVTGLFTDGDDVYAEREHGDLVKLGSVDGKSDDERPEVPGRPSRDGTAWLSAGISDAPAGQLAVTAVERPSQQHRFTRQYTLGHPIIGLNLLDSDLSGIIYVGAIEQIPGETPDQPAAQVDVLCLDPLDGRPLGRATLPPNDEPDETFREISVTDDGTILYLHRTAEGSQLMRANCFM